jgi:putative colanic acid biosynthesis glycosyltransferase
MKGPVISVIIPVFNGAKTLEAALHSVWNQSYTEREIIVIDGASTDGTVSILESNTQRIDRWISEPDTGVYSAINKGIRHATGDWIYVLGSDDVLASSDVLKVVAGSVDNSTRLLYGSVINRNKKHSLVPHTHSGAMNGAIYFRNTLHQQSAFYHRCLFATGAFDVSMKVLADYDFHLSIYHQGIRGKKIALIVAECEASGLSKQFGWSLYREEIGLKRKQLGRVAAVLLIPVVLAKYLMKQVIQ